MERRYNIVDAGDLSLAKELLGRRMGTIKSPAPPEKPAGSNMPDQSKPQEREP
jgi:hypothetical protein